MSSRKLILTSALLCFLAALPMKMDAQGLKPGQLVTLRLASDPQISPDGRHVAFSIDQSPDSTAPAEQSWIWMVATTPNSRPIRMPAALVDDYAARWSPDGATVGFLSRRKHDDPALDGTQQIYLATADGDAARRLTSARTGVNKFVWSPDGKFIAFLSTDTAERGKAFAFSDAIVSGRRALTRLWILDVATRREMLASREPVDIREIAWSPDASEIAAIVAPSASSDDEFRQSLVVIDRTTGRITRTLSERVTGVTRVLSWSPDGAWITFFENSERLRAFWLAVAPARGGAVAAVLKDYPGTVMQTAWTKSKDELALVMLTGVKQEIKRVNVSTRADRTLADITTSQATWGFSSNGTSYAYLAETSTSPADVWMLDAAGVATQLTHLNSETESWRLGAVRPIEWRSSVDGQRIEGVLILPPGYTALRKYPTVVHMHPGDLPWWPGWIGSWWAWGQLLATHGYVVFMPNYRGVNGYGWRSRETLGDWGGTALQDMLDGVDRLVADGISDSDRLGIGGWSNGGFMTEWAITHTTRFKAAVAQSAHADLWAIYGTSQNDLPAGLKLQLGSDPYTNRAVYDAHSPITFVKNARTPTLLLHGVNDSGVPVTQAREFYRGLRENGVETELVLYPGEGHGISRPAHRTEIQARVLDWFDRHLK